MAADAGTLQIRALFDNAEFIGELKKTFKEVQDTAKKSQDSLESISNGFRGIMDAVAGLAALGGLAKFAGDALEISQTVGKLHAGFVALNGPTAETEKIFSDLSELEMHSLFDFEDVLGPAAKNMMMLGVSAEQTGETMKAVVDAAAGMKQGPEWIQGVTGALATMQSHLVASGKDMKALQALGVDAWGALAKEISGGDIKKAMDMVKDGLVTADTVTKAVTKSMADSFSGAAERSMDSWKGAMHALDQTWEDAKKGLGDTIQDLLKELKPIIEGITAALRGMIEWWGKLSPEVKTAIVVITGVTTAVIGFSVAWKAMQLAMSGMSLNPTTVAIGLLVSALVLLGKWVIENWPAIKAAFEKMWDGVKQAWQAFADWVRGFATKTWDFLAEKLAIFAPVVAALKGIWGFLTSVWAAEFNAIKKIFETVFGGIIHTFQDVGALFGKFISWVGGLAQKIPGVKEFGKAIADSGEAFAKTKTQMDAAAKASEDKKKADEAAAAAANAGVKASERLAAQQLAEENARRKAAEAAKKQAEEQKKWAAEREQWNKKIERSNEQLAASEKALEKTWTDANIKFRQQSDQTVEIVVSNFERWGEASDMVKFLRVQDALKKLGVTSEAVYSKAVRDAEEHAAVVEAAFENGEASARDYEEALKAVQKAQKALADYMNSDMIEAFKSIGEKTLDQLNEELETAQKNYDLIVDSAQASADARLKAERNVLLAMERIYKAAGQELPEAERKRLEEIEKILKEHAKKQKNVWAELFDWIKDRARQFKNDVIDVMFERLFGDPNKELKKQEAELVASLAERSKEWDAYVAENAAQVEELTAQYHDALAKQAQETDAALADAADAYAEYADEVAGNIEEIREKHAKELAEEIGDAEDALAEKTQDYRDYVEEVTENIDEIREKYREQLEEENEDLADALADRATQYSDFVRDTNTKLSRIGQDTATNIEDETEDTQRNIAERKLDYQRYAEDTAKKIAEVRTKNKGVYSDEERDLEVSLKRKAEDLQSYIDEQNEKLERYIRDQKLREEREVADANTALSDKTRDYDEWQKDTLEKHDEKVAHMQEAEEQEVSAQREALDKKTADYDKFVADTAEKIDGVKTKHAEEQDAEIAKQKESLDKKKADYDQHVADILLKNDEAVAGIEEDYIKSTADLHRELENQKADYAAFVADITGPGGKLDQLKEQHRTIWGDISALAVGALQDIGKEILHVASDEIIGALTKKSSGLKDIWEAISGLWSKSPSAPSVPSVPGGGDIPGGGVPGGGIPGSGSGGGLGGFLGSGLFGNILSGATLVSSIIGNFQNARQETTLNAIEESTRYSALYLGARADGGIIQILFRLLDEVSFGGIIKAAEDHRNKFFDWTGVITPIAQAIQFHVGDIAPRLDLSNELLGGILSASQSTATSVGGLADRPIQINISPQGLTTAEAARALGNQIARNMTTQFATV